MPQRSKPEPQTQAWEVTSQISFSQPCTARRRHSLADRPPRSGHNRKSRYSRRTRCRSARSPSHRRRRGKSRRKFRWRRALHVSLSQPAWQTGRARVTIGEPATVDALGAAALEARATDAGVGKSRCKFRWHPCTARCRHNPACRHPCSAHNRSTRYSRCRWCGSHSGRSTHQLLTDLAGSAGCLAVAAEERVGLRVHAGARNWGATLESGVANTVVDIGIADLIGCAALVVLYTATADSHPCSGHNRSSRYSRCRWCGSLRGRTQAPS